MVFGEAFMEDEYTQRSNDEPIERQKKPQSQQIRALKIQPRIRCNNIQRVRRVYPQNQTGTVGFYPQSQFRTTHPYPQVRPNPTFIIPV